LGWVFQPTVRPIGERTYPLGGGCKGANDDVNPLWLNWWRMYRPRRIGTGRGIRHTTRIPVGCLEGKEKVNRAASVKREEIDARAGMRGESKEGMPKISSRGTGGPRVKTVSAKKNNYSTNRLKTRWGGLSGLELS